jgi:hypothetical protein
VREPSNQSIPSNFSPLHKRFFLLFAFLFVGAAVAAGYFLGIPLDVVLKPLKLSEGLSADWLLGLSAGLAGLGAFLASLLGYQLLKKHHANAPQQAEVTAILTLGLMAAFGLYAVFQVSTGLFGIRLALGIALGGMAAYTLLAPLALGLASLLRKYPKWLRLWLVVMVVGIIIPTVISGPAATASFLWSSPLLLALAVTLLVTSLYAAVLSFKQKAPELLLSDSSGDDAYDHDPWGREPVDNYNIYPTFDGAIANALTPVSEPEQLTPSTTTPKNIPYVSDPDFKTILERKLLQGAQRSANPDPVASARPLPEQAVFFDKDSTYDFAQVRQYPRTSAIRKLVAQQVAYFDQAVRYQREAIQAIVSDDQGVAACQELERQFTEIEHQLSSDDISPEQKEKLRLEQSHLRYLLTAIIDFCFDLHSHLPMQDVSQTVRVQYESLFHKQQPSKLPIGSPYSVLSSLIEQNNHAVNSPAPAIMPTIADTPVATTATAHFHAQPSTVLPDTQSVQSAQSVSSAENSVAPAFVTVAATATARFHTTPTAPAKRPSETTDNDNDKQSIYSAADQSINSAANQSVSSAPAADNDIGTQSVSSAAVYA